MEKHFSGKDYKELKTKVLILFFKTIIEQQKEEALFISLIENGLVPKN